MEKKDIPNLIVLASVCGGILKHDRFIHPGTRRAVTHIALTLQQMILETELSLPEGDKARSPDAAERLKGVKRDLEKLAFFKPRPKPGGPD